MRLKICVFKEWDNSDSTRFVSLKEWAKSDSIFHNEKIFGRSMNLIQMGSKSCFVKKKKGKRKRKRKGIKSFTKHEEWKGIDLEEHWFLVELLVSLSLFH